MSFLLFDGLPLGRRNRERFWDKLKAAHRGDPKPAMDYLYRSLETLDAKSASMLQFNAILTATILLIVANFYSKSPETPLGVLFLEHWDLSAAFALSVFALFLLVMVEGVKFYPQYHRLDDVDPVAILNAHADHIVALRNRRVVYFRLAWSAAVVALVLMVAHFVAYVAKLPMPGV